MKKLAHLLVPAVALVVASVFAAAVLEAEEAGVAERVVSVVMDPVSDGPVDTDAAADADCEGDAKEAGARVDDETAVAMIDQLSAWAHFRKKSPM